MNSNLNCKIALLVVAGIMGWTIATVLIIVHLLHVFVITILNADGPAELQLLAIVGLLCNIFDFSMCHFEVPYFFLIHSRDTGYNALWQKSE